MSNDNTGAVAFEPTDGQKKLLRAVKLMGAALVLLFLALIGGIIWKATRPNPALPAVEQVTDLKLVPSDIRQMALDGDRLAVTTAEELIVIDLRSKTVVLRVGRKP